jgi:hypothetical protein
MKLPHKYEQERLDLLYAVVDQQYAVIRRFARLQRQAIRIGAETSVRVCDAAMVTAGKNLDPIWNEILSIVNPAMDTKREEPAPEPEITTAPAKEWKQ